MFRSFNKTLRIGTRGSNLAIAQTNEVVRKLKSLGVECEIVKIKTTGDLITDKPLVDIGGKALFLKEIEEHLISSKIDIAVHSLKDVPAILPDGLIIQAVTERLSAADDVLISHNLLLEELPFGSTIGTCASRRKAFLQYFFRDKFKIIDLRGNIDTRIAKFKSGEVDGLILAQAGIERLQLQQHIVQVIPNDIMLPAIGQGVIAVECRQNDERVIELLENINHQDTYNCIAAERRFMIEMGGNCKTPIAALATIDSNNIHLRAAFAMPDGSHIFQDEAIGDKIEVLELGIRVAQNIKNQIIQSSYVEQAMDLIEIK